MQSRDQARRSIRRTETIGFVVIVVLVVAMIVVRWGNLIPWSAR